MRARRALRPVLETMSSRIAPSGLLPHDNPVLAPVIIKDTPPPSIPPLAPVLVPAAPCYESFVGDGAPPPVGVTAPLYA